MIILNNINYLIGNHYQMDKETRLNYILLTNAHFKY